MPSTTITLKGEDRTKKAFSQVQKNLGSLNKSISGVKSGLVALVGTAGFGALSKSLIDTADQLGKTSARLGVSTKELQSLRFAAEQSGVATSTFDMALQRFTRRTAEAAGGTGVAKDALNELGISLKDSEGNLKSNERLLKEVANAMPNVESQAERVRIAFKLFDSEGVKMVNMLQGGRENLEALQTQFENTGAVISNSFIVSAEALNDRLNILSKSFQGNLATALSGVLAQLTSVNTEMEGLSNISRLIGRFFNFLMMGFRTLIEQIRFIITQLVTGLGGAFEVLKLKAIELFKKITFGDVEKATKNLKIAQADLNLNIAEGVKLHARNIEKIKEGYENGLIALGILEKQKEEVKKTNIEVSKAIDLKGKETEKTKTQAALTLKSQELFTKQFDIQTKKTKEIQNQLKQQRDHYKKVHKIVEQIDKVMPKGFTRPSTWTAARSIVEKSIEAFNSFTLTMGGFTDDIFAAAGKSGSRMKGMTDAFAKGSTVQEGLMNATMNMILSNEKVQEALGKVFDAIFALVDPLIESLIPVFEALAEIMKELKPLFELMMPAIKAAAEVIKAVLHPIKELAKILGKIADALSFGGGGGDIKKNVDPFGLGNLLGLQGLQHGGPALANRPYIVGEAGPELFIPNQSGRVVSNQDSFGPVTVNIYDGTGRRISEYDSAIRVEIENRANRNNQFAALAA